MKVDLRRRLTVTAATISLAMCACSAYAAMPVKDYLALRSKICSPSITLNHVSQDPFNFKGRTIEVRGTVRGIARNSAGTSVILGTTEGCYVLSASKDCDIQSGSQVCALVTIGENCTVSLSDLRLVGAASLSDVRAKEQQAEVSKREAEARKQSVAQAMTKVSPTTGSRTFRGATTSTSRGMGDIYSAYRKAVAKFNKKLTPSEVDAITTSILEFSRRENVDPRLVMAVILAESHFNPDATSRCGAMGLGQLMPGTAKGLGVSNAYDPVANIEGAVKLIKSHLTKYSGSSDWNDLDWTHIQLALASYNAGPGAVKKYGGVPPYRETQEYIAKVLEYYKELCGIE